MGIDLCECSAYSYPHRKGGGECEGGDYCYHCGEPFEVVDYIEEHAATHETPAEGICFCPSCGKELEE